MMERFVYFLPIWLFYILIPAYSAETDKCLKSFPANTNDELMNALYLADPNPKTGYMGWSLSFRFGTMEISGSLVDDEISYSTWLTQTHDARIELINLWTYLTRNLVSNVYELYAHYHITKRLGSRKPQGAIDFSKLYGKLNKGCRKWDENKNDWPYNCFSSEFFCGMVRSLESQKNIVMYTDYVFENGRWTFKQTLVELKRINSMSKFGIDNSVRVHAIVRYFDSKILKFVPDKTQSDVFYHSGVIWRSIDKLREDSNSFREWITNQRTIAFGAFARFVESRCSTYKDQPVGIKYFCKAKEYTKKLQRCSQLADTTPCLYDNMVQGYFTSGRFGSLTELEVINKVIDKTKSVLSDFKNRVVANDRSGLVALYNKFNPSITVDDSMCTADWPNAFNCTNNVGCGTWRGSPWSFDCYGGFTCRINMMYRFDCMIKFILKQTKILTDVAASASWTTPAVKKAKYDLMIWLSYLPMARYTSLSHTDINAVVISTQKEVNRLVSSYDTDGLKRFVTNLPSVIFAPQWSKDAACQTDSIPIEYNIFCNLDPLFNSIYLFISAFDNSAYSTTRVLNPSVDYRELLGQLQLIRMGRFINLHTQNLFNDLENQLQQNFGELSNYFSSLANYDRTKADSDIAYINGRLQLFKQKIGPLLNHVESQFTTVFHYAVGINVAELAQRTVELGVAIAQVAHPKSLLLGGSSFLDLLSAINELAQAGVTTAIIATLKDQTFPDLVKKAQELGQGFLQNEEQLDEAYKLINQLKSGADAVATADTFLGKYDAYSPSVLRSDITSYGTLFETAAEQLCEAAFSSGTAAAALGEIALASTGDCTKISANIAKLIVLYEEFYDYQFDMMDALSDAARSYLAYKKATDMKLIYTQGPRVDNAFLRYIAVNTFMISTLNVWEIVTEYCDILTYTRGGQVPDKCERALVSPSHDAVAQVIAYRPESLCHTNNEIIAYRTIPVTPSHQGDKAYIDLNKLYNRETVTFKVPNFQWLKDNKWVGQHDQPKAMYISQFELFLPPMSGHEVYTMELEVKPSMGNYLRYTGTKYLLPVSGYTTRYSENEYNCFSNQLIASPYALCRPTDLAKLCMKSRGTVTRDIQPSIYNEWKITAKSIPENQVAPRPVTNFKLQVGITMCVFDLAPSFGKRQMSSTHKSLKKRASKKVKRGEQHCCQSNEYWSGSACRRCPNGSTQKLKGYYCA